MHGPSNHHLVLHQVIGRKVGMIDQDFTVVWNERFQNEKFYSIWRHYDVLYDDNNITREKQLRMRKGKKRKKKKGGVRGRKGTTTYIILILFLFLSNFPNFFSYFV